MGEITVQAANTTFTTHGSRSAISSTDVKWPCP